MDVNGSLRILIAEDSATIRHHLSTIIAEMPGMQVVGQAKNGQEAVQLAVELQPDVISMDVQMPRMDGFEATRRIMEKVPTPVVVVSGLIEKDIELSFKALEAGALAVVEKPPGRSDPSFPAKQQHFLKTLSAMAGVSVVRRGRTDRFNKVNVEEVVETPAMQHQPEIVAIGASAGGPSALSKLLQNLPPDFSLPVVVVQHMPHEFVAGLARWLEKMSSLAVRVAEDKMILAPGVVYLSPGTAHLRVERMELGLRARLNPEQGDFRHQPSVDVLFESVAETCGADAIGVILTGMGTDGAQGLLRMRDKGAKTFAQDRASSTVFGMPAAAIDRGAAEYVLSLAELPTAILQLL